MGCLRACVGVVGQGQTRVLAVVHGPHEVLRRADAVHDKVCVCVCVCVYVCMYVCMYVCYMV
jgi:hypothetical protein